MVSELVEMTLELVVPHDVVRVVDGGLPKARSLGGHPLATGRTEVKED